MGIEGTRAVGVSTMSRARRQGQNPQQKPPTPATHPISGRMTGFNVGARSALLEPLLLQPPQQDIESVLSEEGLAAQDTGGHAPVSRLEVGRLVVGDAASAKSIPWPASSASTPRR
jgi:hypothetical protein